MASVAPGVKAERNLPLLDNRVPRWMVGCDRTRSERPDRKSTRLNSSHSQISYAVFCLKKKNTRKNNVTAMRNPMKCSNRTCGFRQGPTGSFLMFLVPLSVSNSRVIELSYGPSHVSVNR